MVEATESIVRPDAEVASQAGVRCRLCGTIGQSKRLISDGAAELRKCWACGVTFREPPPPRAPVQSYFAGQYIDREDRLENDFGKSRDDILTPCAEAIRREKSGGRILDVGCAGGYFLHRFFSTPQWERFGVEPSRYAAARAEAHGIVVYRGELISAKLPSRYFDAITVLDLLNFLEEPLREMRLLRPALKPGGLLAVELPLLGAQMFRHNTRLGRMLAGPGFSLINGYFQFYYSKRSLSLLLGESGFSNVRFLSLPGHPQTHALHRLAYGGYYAVSRLLSELSRGKLVAGPNCLAIARATEAQSSANGRKPKKQGVQ